MKRFNVLPGDAKDDILGGYYLVCEIDATIAEKDKEIARLDAGWHEANFAALEKSEELRASNKALVAAQARISELTEFVNMCADEVSEFEANREINGNWANRAAELMESSNPTALAEKDKEIARLDTGWNEANIDKMDYAKQLRASNEALVDLDKAWRYQIEKKNEALVAAEAKLDSILPLFLNAADNLADMPVSDKWAEG